MRLKAEVTRPTSFVARAASSEDGVFSLGQRVLHPMFGEGSIIDLEGSGARTRVQVNFDRAGTKWLMLSHAKLQAA